MRILLCWTNATVDLNYDNCSIKLNAKGLDIFDTVSKSGYELSKKELEYAPEAIIDSLHEAYKMNQKYFAIYSTDALI